MKPREMNLDELVRSHQRPLYGFFRARVPHDSTAEDLAQETWVEVLQRIHTFDPERGSRWTFVKIWARIVLQRHYAGLRQDIVRATGGTGEGEEEPDGISVDISDDERFGVGDEERRNASRSFAQALDDAKLYRLLLRVSMGCRRPPHERIIFGFSRLEWKPNEIVSELSADRLADLLDRLQGDYAAITPMIDVGDAFATLREQMVEQLDGLLHDKRTKDVLQSLLDRIAGETTLREYFPTEGRAEDAVVRWWYSVKRSTLKEIERQGWDNWSAAGTVFDQAGKPPASPS